MNQEKKAIFFGHYWLTGEPKLYKDNVCCLDYSVAKEENWQLTDSMVSKTYLMTNSSLFSG